MEQSQLSKIVKVLAMAYPYFFKDMSEEDIMSLTLLYRQKLKNYDYPIVAKAIDEIITNNKFMPSLAEVLDECNRQQRIFYKKKIDLMYEHGYFRTEEEYGKCLTWLFEERPIIPEWLKKEMLNYSETKQIKEN